MDNDTNVNMDQNTQAQMKQLIQRIESLDEQKDELAEDIKEVYEEAGVFGLDKTILRKVVARRKAKRKSEQKFDEQNILIELYETAINE